MYTSHLTKCTVRTVRSYLTLLYIAANFRSFGTFTHLLSSKTPRKCGAIVSIGLAHGIFVVNDLVLALSESALCLLIVK